MFKATTTYTVSPQTKLDEIFPDGLPIGAFIDKGRCAIGATYGEIINKTRSTLIAVPNISILLNKQASHPEIDIVYGEKGYEDVVAMLSVYKPGHKILTTPEGVRKIMIAAQETGRLTELYTKWFLLLDECHTFISEHYREGILEPFDHFWNFHNRSLISATPYPFSDPQFEEKLNLHQIRFNAELGTVTLVNAVSVIGTLNYLLQNLDKFPGNVHIFYNSVTEIKNAILRSGITDFNIFCADDKDHKNLNKLGDLVKYFVSEPKDGIYKKVNFYTSKYFEGWDLYDDNATVVLVTDVHKSHTKVGASSKGKQAIGRLRNPAYQVIHITNHNHSKAVKSLGAFKEEYLFEANYLIKQYNERVSDFTIKGIAIKEDEQLNRYADIDKETKLATLNLMKLDQQINEAANNEIYNHISYIQKDWEDAFFNVKLQYSDKKLETETKIKRKSAAVQLQEDYLALLTFKREQEESTLFFIGNTPEQQIKSTNPTAYLAYQHLDEATMLKLKYNIKKVQAAIIMKENIEAERKLLKLLKQTFKVGEKYTNKYIKSKLQEFYNQLNIRDENGKIRVATATQLGERGRFEIKDDKLSNNKGQRESALLIVRPQFELKMAA